MGCSQQSSEKGSILLKDLEFVSIQRGSAFKRISPHTHCSQTRMIECTTAHNIPCVFDSCTRESVQNMLQPCSACKKVCWLVAGNGSHPNWASQYCCYIITMAHVSNHYGCWTLFAFCLRLVISNFLLFHMYTHALQSHPSKGVCCIQLLSVYVYRLYTALHAYPKLVQHPAVGETWHTCLCICSVVSIVV